MSVSECVERDQLLKKPLWNSDSQSWKIGIERQTSFSYQAAFEDA